MNNPWIVTIDTNIFEGANFDFREGKTLYAIKKYVDEKRVKVVLSSIVIDEVEKHIKSRMKCLAKEIKMAKKGSRIYCKELNETLKGLKEDQLSKTKLQEFQKFIQEIRARTIGYNLLSSKITKEVFESYFNVKPPFGGSEEKKKEFPDAFIIQQILAYCRKYSKDPKYIAVVTNDKLFAEACKEKGIGRCFESLKSLYDCLYREDDPNMHDLLTKLIEDSRARIEHEIKEGIMKSEYWEPKGKEWEDDDDYIERDIDINGKDFITDLEGTPLLLQCYDVEVYLVENLKTGKILVSRINREHSKDKEHNYKVCFEIDCEADIEARGFYFPSDESGESIDDPLEEEGKCHVKFKCDFECDLKFDVKEVESKLNFGQLEFRKIKFNIQLKIVEGNSFCNTTA